MMQNQCPTHRLPQLIEDSLPKSDADEVMNHLEGCESCQSRLESLAADESWWQRTSQGLSGIPVGAHSHLPDEDHPASAVEALLDAIDSNDRDDQSAEAILDPPTHPEMLGRIDEFDIEEQIGRGGIGVVFRGFDRSLNRPVAIKVMSPHLSANDLARQRFAREAQAAAAVVHPHVVPIYRVNSSPERPYIAMALVDGQSLQERVTSVGPLRVKDIVRVSIQIADGLAAAHRQDLVHRDIKPANILTEKDVSRVMITDFGLARAIDEIAMTQSGCLAGTPSYMSPEQVTGGVIDHRSDLFSFGGLMYFLAAGREPFRADNTFALINTLVTASPTSARRLNAEVPETLDRIIGHLLEKNPADRIPSAEELHDLLTQYLAHLQSPEQHTEPVVNVPRSRQRRIKSRVVLTAAIVVCGIAAAFGINALMSGGLAENPGDSSPEPSPSSGEHRNEHEDEHRDKHRASDVDGQERHKHREDAPRNGNSLHDDPVEP